MAEAKRKVTAQEVRSILTPLVLVFSPGAAAETNAFWAAYAKVLAQLHPAQLQKGAEAYLELPEARFFPKPGELLQLSRSRSAGLFAAACHAHLALSYRPEPERKVLSFDGAAEAAKTRRMLEASRKDTFPKRQAPPPPTPTDEHGLSPAMRQRIEGARTGSDG